MKISLNYKEKKVEIDVKVCNWFERFLGLMFTRRNKAKALLFDFKEPTRRGIHSYFVFFPFVVIWLDDKNRIVDLRLIKSFTFFVQPKKSFFKLIEIPINKEYDSVVKLLCSQSHPF